MSKVIETNLSLDNDDNIIDFQSRVIQVDSWNTYVNEIGNGDTVFRHAMIGSLYGNSVPRSSKVENFSYDDFHLSCDIYNYHGMKSKKLAYLAESNSKIVFENGSTVEFVKSNNSTRGKGWGIYDIVPEAFIREYECKFTEDVE